MISYVCPSCKGQLKIDGKIIFSTRTLDKKVGLILMDPKMGEYSYVHHPSFEFIKGELVEFYCPICHANLECNDKNENLAHVIMIDKRNEEHDILFSRRAGEHCTFKIKGSDIESFGKDSYIYFEDLSQMK